MIAIAAIATWYRCLTGPPTARDVMPRVDVYRGTSLDACAAVAYGTALSRNSLADVATALRIRRLGRLWMAQ